MSTGAGSQAHETALGQLALSQKKIKKKRPTTFFVFPLFSFLLFFRPMLSPFGVKPRSQSRSQSGAAAATSLLLLLAPKLKAPRTQGAPALKHRDPFSPPPPLSLPRSPSLAPGGSAALGRSRVCASREGGAGPCVEDPETHVCSGQHCTYHQIGNVFLCERTGKAHSECGGPVACSVAVTACCSNVGPWPCWCARQR